MLFNSPIGTLKIDHQNDQVISLSFMLEASDSTIPENEFEQIILDQLKSYFDGNLKNFDLPLAPKGTDFEQKVWNEVSTLPFGSTSTYGTIAKKLGDSNLMRAVGRANGSNPIPIMIPCHRVIASNNHLTGYSGGLERKRWLLQHEGSILL